MCACVCVRVRELAVHLGTKLLNHMFTSIYLHDQTIILGSSKSKHVGG